jgi:hypothetical protein
MEAGQHYSQLTRAETTQPTDGENVPYPHSGIVLSLEKEGKF